MSPTRRSMPVRSKSLVNGKRFHKGRKFMEDLTDLLGQFQVSSIAAFDKDALRAPLQGFLHGHGRVDTKAPGFIRGRGDNALPESPPTMTGLLRYSG